MLKKFLVILLTSTLFFIYVDSIQVQACNNKVFPVKEYKGYGKQETIKYMCEDQGKVLESLNVIIKSGLKSKKGDADKILDQLRVRRFICILTKTAFAL